MKLSKAELDELRRAKEILENPGLAAKLSALAGAPIEKGMALLPARWQKGVHQATETALMKALELAVRSLGGKARLAPSNKFHKMAVATSGAIGGAFGIAALGIELPVSTGLILRSIADIAASQGESPREIDTKLACLMVFALGSPRDPSDDAAESGYFAARSALAPAVTEASRHLAQKGLAKGSGPSLVRLISLI
ncbi:MAG TPA: EcsC family protein, partial [Usitatibacter sp.]